MLIRTPNKVAGKKHDGLKSIVYDNEERNAGNIQRYKDILNDPKSWEPHSLDTARKASSIMTFPHLGFQFLDAYNRARTEVADKHPQWASEYNPNISSHRLDANFSKEISALLVEQARPFFEHIIQQYNTVQGIKKIRREYDLAWRFDKASHDYSNTWHMDNLSGKRTYASDGAHAFHTSLVMAFCRDATSKEIVECATQLLLGVPVLTVEKFQELCDIDPEGLMFVKRAPFTQEGIRQHLADMLQESTLEVLEQYTDKQLEELGFKIHQNTNFLLQNTVQYLFHRGQRWQEGVERVFLIVNQGPPESKELKQRALNIQMTVDNTPTTLHIYYN